MQNEPNFNTKALTKHTNGANFTLKKYLFLINSYTLLLIFSPKARTFTNFFTRFSHPFACSFSPIPPKPPSFTHKNIKYEINYAKRTQLQYSKSKIGNRKSQIPLGHERPATNKYAKQTQSTKSYVPEGTKTNPIYKQSPVSAYVIRTYGNTDPSSFAGFRK